ncbi:hypothetical protein GUJ93_ZPchr0006g44213 [Zizania palustris]|uniref:Uncharacterized protein n=1 Tax=Zizania palustris TaxID=103762 RepID=A0A8J5VWI7_ZIZPA|nr:hypothetical protein GUJ93_ZPchr0006g44213 [Zizania palustris]
MVASEKPAELSGVAFKLSATNSASVPLTATAACQPGEWQQAPPRPRTHRPSPAGQPPQLDGVLDTCRRQHLVMYWRMEKKAVWACPGADPVARLHQALAYPPIFAKKFKYIASPMAGGRRTDGVTVHGGLRKKKALLNRELAGAWWFVGTWTAHYFNSPFESLKPITSLACLKAYSPTSQFLAPCSLEGLAALHRVSTSHQHPRRIATVES